jgi:nucleotide-binding universal stress UspA family protein
VDGAGERPNDHTSDPERRTPAGTTAATTETVHANHRDDDEESAMGSRSVVVGVDGSDSSDAAARWAAFEATRRQLPLLVVHAVMPPTPAAVDWEGWAAGLLDTTIGPLRRLHPDLEIRTQVHVGLPAALALSSEAQSAELLVVGSRGRGGFTTLLLGSTAIQVLETAPVVIVRQPPPDQGEASPGGPVVVGVDGSDPSRRALHFAFTEAALRETTLTAVHAWAIPDHPGLTSMRASGGADWSFLAQQAADVLEEALAAVRADFPDVEVTEHLVDDQPVPALLEASRHAQLLVLGSHGRGAFSGLVLGSVSHSAVRGADCPVAVIR